MNSTQYGESLLADMRERNDKKAKQARKRAQRNEWKQLGVDLLMSTADDLLDRRREEFLNNEDKMAEKLKIKTAGDYASRIHETNEAADAFAGGREMYFQAKAKPQVDLFLQEMYPDGNYNKAEYDSFATGLSSLWGQELQKRHDSEYGVTKEFLEKTGGGDAVTTYNEALGRTKGKGIQGFISDKVGQMTGLMKKDSANLAASLHTKAEDLIAFKKAYAKSGDPTFASFVATNKLLQNVDLGVKAPTISDVKYVKDEYGKEIPVKIITKYDKEGQPASITEVKIQDGGRLSFTNGDVAAAENDFTRKVSVILADENSPIRAQGQLQMSRLSAEDNTAVENRIKAIAFSRNQIEETDPLYADIAEKEHDRLEAFAGVAALELTKQNLFNSNQAALISNRMVIHSVETPNNKVFSSIGYTNPYHTLRGAYDAIGRGMGIPSTIEDLYDGNEVNMLRAYRSESKDNRTLIDTFIEKSNGFESMLGSGDGDKPNYLATVHTAIQHIVNNPSHPDYFGQQDSIAISNALKNTASK